jgi:hypothetical protein
MESRRTPAEGTGLPPLASKHLKALVFLWKGKAGK